MSTQTAKTRFAAPGGAGGGIAITVEDEGAPVVAGVSVLNFTGLGVTATNAGGGVAQIDVPALAIEDEGISIETTTTIVNFIGGGVTATSGGAGIVDVTIPSLTVKDEGISIETATTTMNFVGGGVTATSGGANIVTVTIPAAPTPTITVNDEGLLVNASVTTLNFTGGGVAASNGAPGIVNVTVPTPVVAVEDEGLLVDASTSTFNFIGAGVTATSGGPGIVDVTIPGGGGAVSTAITGLYYVATNGVDLTADGSLTKPFRTIQAAINKAVADGHTCTNMAEVLVLPNDRALPYGGFTTANGVNVKGLHADNAGVYVTGNIVVTADAPPVPFTYVELSNLQVDLPSAGVPGHCVEFTSINTGQLLIDNCTFSVGAGFSCVYMNSSPSTVTIRNSTFNTAYAATFGVNVNAGTATLTPGNQFNANRSTISVAAGATFNANGCVFFSQGTVASPVISCAGSVNIDNSVIVNLGLAVGNYGIQITGGGISSISRTSISMFSGVAIDLAATASLGQSLVSFPGTVTTCNLLGTLISSPVLFVPSAPANWLAPAPQSYQDAINRIAASVAGLLGGPIP